tara:strand:+ start:632 stop:1045 length:414 start_codon:yes stop_codon:yes gene_type:complete
MIDKVLFDVNPINRALWSTHNKSVARELTTADIRAVLKKAGVVTTSGGKGKKSLAKAKKPELLEFAQKCADLLDIYNAREIKKIPGSLPKFYLGFAKWLNGSIRGEPELQGFNNRSPAIWSIDDDIINALAQDELNG